MPLACSSGPPSLEPAHPALRRKSTLFVAGDRFTYAPLPRINVTFAHSVTPATLDTAMNVSDAARAQWRAIASLPSGPRIAILGTHAACPRGAASYTYTNTGCACVWPWVPMRLAGLWLGGRNAARNARVRWPAVTHGWWARYGRP